MHTCFGAVLHARSGAFGRVPSRGTARARCLRTRRRAPPPRSREEFRGCGWSCSRGRGGPLDGTRSAAPLARPCRNRPAEPLAQPCRNRLAGSLARPCRNRPAGQLSLCRRFRAPSCVMQRRGRGAQRKGELPVWIALLESLLAIVFADGRSAWCWPPSCRFDQRITCIELTAVEAPAFKR